MIQNAVVDRMGNLNLVMDINCCNEKKLKCTLLKGGIAEIICTECSKKIFLKAGKVKFS